jgi:23S rRNA maturation-related 3'-5' exoribonuclease YhaM
MSDIDVTSEESKRLSERARIDYMERVNTIVDEDIKKFVTEALEGAPDEFWTASASASGLNHPPEDRIEGGLLIHTIKALEVAESLFRFFGVEDETDRDIVRAALLLHDMYKQGFPWTDATNSEHGQICAMIVGEYALDNDYIKRRIQLCISTHMSRWAYPMESFKNFVIPDKLQIVTALSDYIASRNEISFYPNWSVLG